MRINTLCMSGCLALFLAFGLGSGPAWAAATLEEWKAYYISQGYSEDRASDLADTKVNSPQNSIDEAESAARFNAMSNTVKSQEMLIKQLDKIAALTDGKAPDWSQMERIIGKMMESWPNTTRWLNLIKEENISPELLQILAETIRALAAAGVEFKVESGPAAGYSAVSDVTYIIMRTWPPSWSSTLAEYNKNQALQNAIDALQNISAGNAETLAGMLQNLLDKAGEKGISQETLRDILTDMKNTDSNKWPALLAKYPGAGALANDLLALAKQVQGMNLGNQLPAADALALAEAVLAALEQGYSPQQLAEIKKLTDSGLSVTQALSLMQQRILTAEADLASLLPGAPVTALKNLDINLNIQALGDRLHPGNMQATIQGGLAGSIDGLGTYGFSVNLSSGAASGGFMNVTEQFGSQHTFAASGGSGSVNGNSFTLGGFGGSITDSTGIQQGSITGGSLQGTASNGFGSLGDIGASGTYDIQGDGGLSNSGTITSGERIK